MNLSLSEQLFCHMATVLAGLTLLGLHSKLRRRRFEPPRSDDKVFRCKSCRYVYTDDPQVERSRCPSCGEMNSQFNF